MAQHGTHSIPRDKFLTISVNLLHQALLEVSRTRAKTIYRELAEGRIVPLTRVQMEDRALVQFDLALDHSEYRGKRSFGNFRNSLATLVGRLAEALRTRQDVTVFTAEHDPNVVIFGITGLTWADGHPNVMVLGADAGSGQPTVMLKLMYLDPAQFEVEEAVTEAAVGGRQAPEQGA
ncbi:MAG: hypothetical protein ACK2U9_26010 [Anaerolineae bacterium]